MASITPISQTKSFTPKEVLRGTETYLKKLSPCAIAFNNAMNVLDSFFKMTQLAKLPENVTLLSRSLGLIAVPLIPFQIARFGANLSKALDAEDFPTFVRSSLDSIGGVMLTLYDLISPFKVLRDLRIFDAVPVVPFLQQITLPCSVALAAVRIWNLYDTVRFAWAIHSESREIANNGDSHEVALQQLDDLKSRNISKIEKQFDISKQSQLANRVDSLCAKLQNKEAGAVDEVTEFYATMKKRTIETLGFEVPSAIVGCTFTAITAALMFTPLTSLAGTMMMGITSLAGFGVWAAKELFTSDDIFDPNAKSVFGSAICKAREVATGIVNVCFPVKAVA